MKRLLYLPSTPSCSIFKHPVTQACSSLRIGGPEELEGQDVPQTLRPHEGSHGWIPVARMRETPTNFQGLIPGMENVPKGTLQVKLRCLHNES